MIKLWDVNNFGFAPSEEKYAYFYKICLLKLYKEKYLFRRTKLILLIGKNGQLGKELCNLLDEKGILYLATDSKELDITNKSDVDSYFYYNQPEIVYLCAGYTDVEKAEKEWSLLINYWGTRYVAEVVERIGRTLVYISTDYVFSGKLNIEQKWDITDVMNPLSEYGQTKLLGEFVVIDNNVKHFIIRTSWLFGNYGDNIILTLKNQVKYKQHQKIMVVNDQHGCPTWTRTLAEFMLYLIKNNSELGTYHLTNDSTSSEAISWFDFAKHILEKDYVEVLPISSDYLSSKVDRPYNSTLNIIKAKNTGFLIPTWQEVLEIIENCQLNNR